MYITTESVKSEQAVVGIALSIYVHNLMIDRSVKSPRRLRYKRPVRHHGGAQTSSTARMKPLSMSSRVSICSCQAKVRENSNKIGAR